MRDHLKQLLTYNHEANRRFIDAVLEAGPAGERVAVILSHILNAHRIWNARLGGVTPTGDPRELRPLDAWAPMNRENYERSIQIVEHADLAGVVEYRDTIGNPHRNRAGDILLQVITHSSYHRGQLALLLGQGGKSPPATDFIIYLREQGP